MRILVHEFVSGGGLANQPVPSSLVREGLAMRSALLADLARLGVHEIVATADRRFPIDARLPLTAVTLPPRDGSRRLNALIEECDAAWIVAPESDRCLERLAARVERRGRLLLGSSARAIRVASDKTRLPALLRRVRLPHPFTHVLPRDGSIDSAARRITFPIVVKPGRGAGCGGVSIASNRRELTRAVVAAQGGSRRAAVVLQPLVPGSSASVSLLADGRGGVVPLAVNAQAVRGARPVTYRGGRTPLKHPLAGRARAAALEACRAIPGLRGYVGVDLVLTDTDAVVIEVNPRLTTAYLGVRAAIDANVAGLAVMACTETLPPAPAVRRSVRFTASGRVVGVDPRSAGVTGR